MKNLIGFHEKHLKRGRKTMNKLFVLIIGTLLLLALLVSCSGKKEVDSEKTNTNSDDKLEISIRKLVL
ncbi:hypothetical protein ACA29_00025 [Lederbergia galactosidilytica]|uniref:Uncharacterized protein n=1 Tax=Lederbergia galactosidilytica TaxID=217031 RepID=A0A0Q9YLJ7_9BACI|nr:hypothetical protein ACA29_00025 [Lederbergia galactosidilytica]